MIRVFGSKLLPPTSDFDLKSLPSPEQLKYDTCCYFSYHSYFLRLISTGFRLACLPPVHLFIYLSVMSVYLPAYLCSGRGPLNFPYLLFFILLNECYLPPFLLLVCSRH